MRISRCPHRWRTPHLAGALLLPHLARRSKRRRLQHIACRILHDDDGMLSRAARVLPQLACPSLVIVWHAALACVYSEPLGMLHAQKFCDVTRVSVVTQRQIRAILDALLNPSTPPTSAPGPSAPVTLPPPPPRLPQAAPEPPLLKRKRSPEVPQVWTRVHRKMVPVPDGASSFPTRTGRTQAVEGAPLPRQLDAGTTGSWGY